MNPGRLIGKAPSTPDERRLALRIAAIFAVPLAVIMMVPLGAAFFVYRHETNARLKDDRALIKQVNRERIERSRAINTFVYHQCLDAEIRDVVIVTQLKAAIVRAKATLPDGQLRRQQIEKLKDGIAILEPDNEEDCSPPPAVPSGKP